MEWLKTSLRVGAKAPFTVLHASDTHLALADDRDDARKKELAARRYARHHAHEGALARALSLAKERGLPLMHTGDLIDFVSYANLDRARELCRAHDIFFTAGNHEFSQYMDGTPETEAYRNQSPARVQAAFANDIRYAVREIEGVNFVGLDNSYYKIEAWQLAALKKTVREGKPVVLLLHVPLFTPAQFEYFYQKDGNPAVMGAPLSLLRECRPELINQQQADETTRMARRYIAEESGIRAILTGHQHVTMEDAVTPALTQYLTGCDDIREFTFE